LENAGQIWTEHMLPVILNYDLVTTTLQGTIGAKGRYQYSLMYFIDTKKKVERACALNSKPWVSMT